MGTTAKAHEWWTIGRSSLIRPPADGPVTTDRDQRLRIPDPLKLLVNRSPGTRTVRATVPPA